MKSKCYVRALFVASQCALSADALAQEEKDWSALIGAGGLAMPEFLGSSDYTAVPFLIGTFQKGPYFLKLTGLKATANILPFDSVYAGPLISYGGGRQDLSDPVLKKLPEVDAELWLGGAFGIGYDGLMLQRDTIGARIEIAHDVMGDSGTTATFGIGYEINATQRLAFGIDLETTYADSTYADAYYSVTPAGSRTSGLEAYSAEAGFRDVSLNLTSRFAFNERWGVGALAGGSLVLGDFADSPIVKDHGQSTSGQGGVFLWYRF